MIKLALASNFENEWENIRQIWDLFKDTCFMWTVVDSGSKDRTIPYLKEMVGDKLNLIRSDEIKTKGYGYARTRLIELSEGADWVLILDGDERMLVSDILKILPLIANIPNNYQVIALPRCHYKDWDMKQVEYGSMDKVGTNWLRAISINPDWQHRLIRRIMIDGKSKISFIRRVHETIVGVSEENVYRYLSNPVIRHFGWTKTDERKREIAQLCENLWQSDREFAETYEKENGAGTANVLNPEYLRLLKERGNE